MAIDFHYGGLPPAMARKLQGGMESPSLPAVPQNELPTIPRNPTAWADRTTDLQSNFMSPANAMQTAPNQPATTSLSPFAPQTTQLSQNRPTWQDFTANAPNRQTRSWQDFMPQTESGQMKTWKDFVGEAQSRTGMKSWQDFVSEPAERKTWRDFASDMSSGRAPYASDVDGSGAPSNHKLGSLSSRYESNGNPGVIARTKGDIGGASYGTYQLTTASGNAQRFANQYGGALKGLKAGTAAFDKAWKAEASKNPEAFASAQHNYIKKTHFDPAVNNIKKRTGLDVTGRSAALQDVVWSVGVQHGTGGAASLFKNAGVNSKMTDEQIIKAVYAERKKVDKYFSRSSSSVKKGVYNRFVNEEKQALSMLKNTGAYQTKPGQAVKGNIYKTSLAIGQQYMGNSKYVFGGGRNSKDIAAGRFDCSSFVHYVLTKSGKSVGKLGNTSTETLKKVGKAVNANQMQPGDMVFFDTYKKNGHVGIYVGNGKFIGAQSSTGVAVVDMNDKYWKSKFKGHVRRV